MKLFSWFLLFCLPVQAADSEWKRWVSQQSSEAPAAIQARLIEKTGRVALAGSLGSSERRDLYHQFFGTLAGRYFFQENHGWEFGRVVLNSAVRSSLLDDIEARTGFPTDAQPSAFSVSSSYIFSPIYGKYAWGEDSVVHFDLYALAGLGLRFARDLQPFGELGIGMSHYFGSHFSLSPEVRWRVYSERRMTSILISEVSFQMGASWLF
jgi:outer membrane beta-barrel protein